MNYYDDNQNTEYKDEFYVPKKDKDYKPIKEEKEKKEFRLNKKLLIIIGVILIIFIIGIVFLVEYYITKTPDIQHYRIFNFT